MSSTTQFFRCSNPGHHHATPIIACGVCRQAIAPLEHARPTIDVPMDATLYTEALARLKRATDAEVSAPALWALIDYGMALASAGRVRLEGFRS